MCDMEIRCGWFAYVGNAASELVVTVAVTVVVAAVDRLVALSEQCLEPRA